MIPIVPRQHSESAISRLIGRATPGLETLLDRVEGKKTAKKLEDLGYDVGGVTQPQIQQEILRQKGREKERQANLELGNKEIEIIKNTFGEEVAEKMSAIWPLFSEGAKTDFWSNVLKEKSRLGTFEEAINSVLSQEEEPSTNATIEDIDFSEVQLNKKGDLPKGVDLKLFSKKPKGYTSQEWNDVKKERRKENAPIIKENIESLDQTERDWRDSLALERINNTPEFNKNFQRAITNPFTGQPFAIAEWFNLVDPSVQEWTKIITRFGNRARDAFGGRVTNFELEQYMKQFPSLMNTQEGRQRILNLMNINYELDALYQKALRAVYRRTGEDGISFNQADALARDLIREETNKLRQQYIGALQENEEFVRISESENTERGTERISLEEIFP